jgi:hypothetical protein
MVLFDLYSFHRSNNRDAGRYIECVFVIPDVASPTQSHFRRLFLKFIAVDQARTSGGNSKRSKLGSTIDGKTYRGLHTDASGRFSQHSPSLIWHT